MHGGAKGSGGPRGERNGNFRHGLWTQESVALRRAVATKGHEISRFLQQTKYTHVGNEARGHWTRGRLQSGASAVSLTAGFQQPEASAVIVTWRRKRDPMDSLSAIGHCA